MVNKATRDKRRDAIRRAKQRRRFIAWGAGIVGAAVIGVSAFAALDGGSGGESATALAPAFELAGSDGEPVSLDDYRGVPVAVTFMHTW